MNYDKIDTLLAVAGCRFEFLHGRDYEDFSPYKFAELIVRECIKSTLSLQTAAVEHQWGTEETFHMIVDTIAEDFDMQHIFRS